MSDFEREIVRCLNLFFKTHHCQGFAYRIRQHRVTCPHVDVLADSLNPSYHLAIECKSIIDKKLYFSQHFHSDRKNMHPVQAISDFLDDSGRNGYLGIEFRQGPGKTSEAFLIPWIRIVEHYTTNKGITIDDARAWGICLKKAKDGYVLESL